MCPCLPSRVLPPDSEARRRHCVWYKTDNTGTGSAPNLTLLGETMGWWVGKMISYQVFVNLIAAWLSLRRSTCFYMARNHVALPPFYVRLPLALTYLTRPSQSAKSLHPLRGHAWSLFLPNSMPFIINSVTL